MRGLLLLLLLSLVACSREHRPSVVDPELAACVPPTAAAVAGVDVARLRGTPLYEKVPFKEADYVLAASDGKEWLLVARGQIAGASPIGAGITALGSEALIQAAVAQHRTGKPGAPDLIAHAAETPIWLAARGSMTLPVEGNLANINRLLHQTEYMTLAARVNERVEINAAGECRSPAQAQHLEENVRALSSLLFSKYPVEVHTDGTTVHVKASLPFSAILP
jgi:hypothetical protein